MKQYFTILIFIVSCFIYGCKESKYSYDCINGTEPIGMIKTIKIDQKISDKWVLCDGTGYDTNTYFEIFTLINYSFGGSGSNFYVPNLNAPNSKKAKWKFVIKMK